MNKALLPISHSSLRSTFSTLSRQFTTQSEFFLKPQSTPRSLALQFPCYTTTAHYSNYSRPQIKPIFQLTSSNRLKTYKMPYIKLGQCYTDITSKLAPRPHFSRPPFHSSALFSPLSTLIKHIHPIQLQQRGIYYSQGRKRRSWKFMKYIGYGFIFFIFMLPFLWTWIWADIVMPLRSWLRGWFL